MRPKVPLTPKGAREDVIVFTVGGFRFAIAANAVSEIRGLEDLRRFSLGTSYLRAAQVDFTVERNGTIYFVVDAARHFRLPPSKPTRVLILRQIAAAIQVDSTDRMMEISVLHALPQAFNGDERNWYRGLAVMDGDVVPVVNHNAFLSKAEMAVLKSAVQQVKGAAAV
ncbi:MAG TPA: chemotaxis protein CheW [Candidatus Angelobacter sp.]|nr:chemotaxis protein CheW [Candidatus Angelobacter sp.]